MSKTNLKTVQVQRCGVEPFKKSLCFELYSYLPFFCYHFYVITSFTAEEREYQTHASSSVNGIKKEVVRAQFNHL